MKSAFDLNDYIEEIEINGLRGRMVNAPAKNAKAKNVNILFIHGHHSSLERLAGVTELMVEYGNFCLPDMPGFGGMQHLYSAGLKPTIDNLADYMAAFIKLQYGSRKKFVVVGYSMGFLVLTRMLQKYPELHSRIIDVISLAGFVHSDNMKFSRTRRMFYMTASWILERKAISWVAREIFLRKWFLGSFYAKSHNAKDKFSGLSGSAKASVVDFEVNLWRINHVPTWCFTSRQMLTADLVKDAKQLPLNLIMVVIDGDRYFDNTSTEQCMHVLYKRVKVLRSEVESHGGSVVATADDARKVVPKELIRHLKSLR